MSKKKEEFEGISFDLPKNQSNVIKVIGVGGGGSNAINHMFQQGIKGVDFVICNTDAQALENSPVPIKIQLGVNLTEGLGAGANPEIGEQAALESFEDLKNMLHASTKMIFITAGMGGGTGTGAAPIIAKQAKEMDILTVGIVTIPFQFEGKTRNEQAQIGVEKLRSNVDSLIVINNNKLREVYGNLGFKAGFSKADEVLATASRGIAEVITHHYTQNIDLRDAKTVLSNSGTAIMGSATASGGERAHDAIVKALDSPLLNDNKISGAKNVLLLIVSGSQEITIDEIGEINDHIQAEAGHSANIIMGVGDDEKLEESISVTVIATGFDIEQQNEIVNAETRKIIHTLEDEQKAEQELFPQKTASGPTSGKMKTDENREYRNVEEKIVHVLEEDEEDEQKNSSQKEMKLIPTSEFLRNLDVVYEEVPYEEDDFIIIDTDEKLKNIEVESEEVNTRPEEQTLFSFDFPMKETSKPSEKKTSEKKIVHDLGEKETRNIEVNEEVEIVPTTDSDGTKRYSLDDYMDFEKEMEDAKPQKNRVKEPDEAIVFEKKTISGEEVKKQQDDNSDPFDNPISETLIARAAERREKMKKFNYKFRNSQNLEEIQKQPAYKRAGIDLDKDNPTGKQMSRTTIENDENDEPKMRSNNSFLHDNVD